jgi:hypothetical protein
VLAARAIYRAMRGSSAVGAIAWVALVISAPLWFFFGYLLADNYDQFKIGCATDAGPRIVTPIPTRVPYSDYCNEVKRLLPGGRYEAAECKENRELVRLRFVGGDLAQCAAPSRYDNFPFECFETERVDEISTPYQWTFNEPVARIDSPFFRGRLEVDETKATSADGTLIASLRYYSYAPYGSAILLGGSSASSPRIWCERNRGFPRLEDMFPPESAEPGMAR